jgi:hypothetical protein
MLTRLLKISPLPRRCLAAPPSANLRPVMHCHSHISTVTYIAVMAKKAGDSAPSWMMGKSETSKEIEGLKEKTRV